MKPELRPATPDDLPLVFRLERAYIQDFEPASLQGWTRALDRHLEQWVANLSRMVVAEVAGEATGYYFWEAENEQAVLSSITVLAAYRRQGIGTFLLRDFEHEALKSGVTRLTLGVITHNPAKRLYESAGYTFVRHEGDYCYYEKSPAGGDPI